MNPTEKLNELRHERIEVIAKYKRGGATAYETIQETRRLDALIHLISAADTPSFSYGEEAALPPI